MHRCHEQIGRGENTPQNVYIYYFVVVFALSNVIKFDIVALSLFIFWQLQISDNHVETLQYNLPGSLISLMANRNHISAQLVMSPLPNLTELHIAGNRITSLPVNLHITLPKLDLLDISDNRIDDLRNITNAVSKMKELREMNASKNPCTPLDVNGNVYGEQAMEWWYAIVSMAPQIECLDDMLANSEDVVKSKKSKRRELEIDHRRSDSKGSGISTGTGSKAI